MKPVIYLFIEFISPQLERVKTISNKINKRNTWTEWPILGVLVDAQLSFLLHINCFVAKAHIKAGQILRRF